MTTAMTPNPNVTAVSQAVGFSNAGKNIPMDWASVDENNGGPTYMSLAASSYHPGGVTPSSPMAAFTTSRTRSTARLGEGLARSRGARSFRLTSTEVIPPSLTKARILGPVAIFLKNWGPGVR